MLVQKQTRSSIADRDNRVWVWHDFYQFERHRRHKQIDITAVRPVLDKLCFNGKALAYQQVPSCLGALWNWMEQWRLSRWDSDGVCNRRLTFCGWIKVLRCDCRGTEKLLLACMYQKSNLPAKISVCYKKFWRPSYQHMGFAMMHSFCLPQDSFL